MTSTPKPKKHRALPLQKNSRNSRQVILGEILNLFSDPIVLLSESGGIVDANDAACRILDSEKSFLIGVSIYERCIHEEEAQLRDLVQQAFNDKQRINGRSRWRSRNEQYVDLELSLTRFPNASGKSKRYCVVIGRDISEEKQRELDLLRFSNIAHYTVNPIEITDPHGKVIYVNPAFEKASGYSKEEILGNNPNIFGSGKHPKKFWAKMWATITSGKVWVGEIENRRRNGEPFLTHLLISPIIDLEGAIVGYFGVHRDITGERNLEKQLIHAQKIESIGLLAAGIAHEVGNPLTSISSLVQIIQRSTEDKFTHEKLELIKSQISRISRIIRDLVDFSRRSSYEVRLTDINKCLNEAVEIVRVGRKAKSITFNVELDSTLPNLRLVEDQIQQVFINILINAVDAINSRFDGQEQKREAPAVRSIRVHSTMKDDDVIISIHDNGKGIPEDHLGKIFEPFFTTKQVGEGTGLGLWVSSGIIRSFQGTIEVESAEDVGTTFTVKLPVETDVD